MSTRERTHTMRDYVETLSPEEREQVSVADAALLFAHAFQQAKGRGRRFVDVVLTNGFRDLSADVLRPYLHELGYEVRPALSPSADGTIVRITPLRRLRVRGYTRPRPLRGVPIGVADTTPRAV